MGAMCHPLHHKIVSSVVNCVGVESYSTQLGRLGKAKVDGMRARDIILEFWQNEDAEWLVVGGVILGNPALSILRGVGVVGRRRTCDVR